ncbi:MAG TPA: hypothetical protein VFZ53_10935, partial [Polyangiaceae bacterium]
MSDDKFERGIRDFELSRRLLLGLGGSLGLVAAPGLASAHGRGHGHGPRRMLVKGGTVLTIDPDLGDFTKGDVLVEDGIIRAVGSQLSAHGAEVVDARGYIVMPGFVDTHRHLWQGLLRNIGPDDLLGDYLE